ncbi:hypothetical protein [Poseidonibacter antarcticus]|uniref:hypothetical protein n=1 Tax=Poseidonibacter antarcticus TaxID=2478538 RepID=UPI000EF4A1D8|nr:hypothetical protein [Poseidonibacter antarcticus]
MSHEEEIEIELEEIQEETQAEIIPTPAVEKKSYEVVKKQRKPKITKLNKKRKAKKEDKKAFEKRKEAKKKKAKKKSKLKKNHNK